MFRIYLTDDHAILREGLKALLRTDNELFVAGESGTGQGTIDAISKDQFDLLVLDLHLPDMDGLDVLLHVKNKEPTLPVLILSLHDDANLASRLLTAGASGYAVKDMPATQIIEAMRYTVRGGRFLSCEMALKIAENTTHTIKNKDLHARLTAREYSVFLKLVAGLSINSIARDLGISASTVSTHRAHILEKMDLSNNADLVRYAFTHNLLN